MTTPSPSSSSTSSSTPSLPSSSSLLDPQNAPPSTLEHKHVTEVYDLIALHFSSTRYKAWPRVEAFLKSLPDGAIVADVGCGNGKYLGVNPNVVAIGSDRTGKFAEICAEKGFESMICDNLQLPYRSSSFDSVISIAVVHHFASPERRLQAIKELTRILKCGGRLLFTVWAIQQDWKQKQYGEQDVMIPWHFRDEFKKGQEKAKEKEKKTRAGRLRKKEERKEKFREKTEEDNKHANEKRKQRGKEEEKAVVLEDSLHLDTKESDKYTDNTPNNNPNNDNKTPDNDIQSSSIPTTENKNNDKARENKDTKEVNNQKQPDGEVYHRYYHLFKEGEIEDLFQQVEGVKIVEAVLDHDNWYVIVEKTK